MRPLVESTLREVEARSGIPFAVRFAGRDKRVMLGRDGEPAFTVIFRSRGRTGAWRCSATSACWNRTSTATSTSTQPGHGHGGGDAGRPRPAQQPADAPQPAHEFLYNNASWGRARHNAEFHYSLTPEFYKLWLDDPLMFYTCAYWMDDTRTLEEAQRNKGRPRGAQGDVAAGDDVVDVGSGFGGFLLHAAEHYGVRITSINTTGSQAEHARRQIEKRGLKNAVQTHDDFRSTTPREFDKVVSIGCLEHAGRDQLGELIRAHARLLSPAALA